MNYVAQGYIRSGYIRQDSDTVGAYTFDKYGKHIFVNDTASQIDLADMWSRFVDWFAIGENMKIKPAMRYSGFDPIPTGFTGATFFMINGWKCVYNPNTTGITGVLYSEDYATGYWDKAGNPVYPVTVSAVVNTVTINSGSGLSQAEHDKLTSLENYTGPHADLDTYPNKDDFKADVSNIPTDTVRISDNRLNNLDDKVSSRATKSDVYGAALM